ncbi:MAG: EamA family transporter [Thermoanaerobaculia bacterium]|nr:EamA family transporter [Thermoanaerobaculia bacterium]
MQLARPKATHRTRATLIGSVAVILWSLLALITTGATGIPPFQLTALSFVVGSGVGFVFLAGRGPGTLAKLRQRPAAWLLGVSGLFGFHFFYFLGLARAPAVDASLLTYLWPLLIVLFSALLPGESVRWFHLAGAALGLLGAALLVTQGGSMQLESKYLVGYLAAIAAAVTWAAYSVLNRRFGDVPTEAVAGFCAVTAALAFLCHGALETWVWPSAGQWLSIGLLGLGPVGAAFFVWDHGTKHGDLQILGTLAYAAPLLSTLFLVLAGEAEATWTVAWACLLIAGGALLASKQMLRRRRASEAS